MATEGTGATPNQPAKNINMTILGCQFETWPRAADSWHLFAGRTHTKAALSQGSLFLVHFVRRCWGLQAFLSLRVAAPFAGLPVQKLS